MTPLPQLRADLVAALERQAGPSPQIPDRADANARAGGRAGRRVLLVAALLAVLIAGAAVAATALLRPGAPVELPPGAQVSATQGTGSPVPRQTTLLSLAVPDPHGGPAWGVRFVATTRGVGCLQVGRLVRHTLGVIGQDGALGNDERFHPLATNVLNAALPCALLDARGNAYAGAVLAAPASGLLPPEAGLGMSRFGGCVPGGVTLTARPRLAACPPADDRVLLVGMAGPKATTVTYTRPGGSQTVQTVSAHGVYLFVAAMEPRTVASAPLQAGSLTVMFRGGRVCRFAVVATGQGWPCPELGSVPAASPPPRRGSVASPVAVTVIHDRSGAALRVAFVAHRPVTSARERYVVDLRFPAQGQRCGYELGMPVSADVRSGQTVTTTIQTGGCMGTFHGVVTYSYGPPRAHHRWFDVGGPALRVGGFTTVVR